MKSIKQFAAIMIIIVLIGSIIITSYTIRNRETKQEQDKKFYVGVTYCGSSVQEAKELIDKVKDRTNIFVLQSGAIQSADDRNAIGDYVIASKLNFAVYASNAAFSGGVFRINEWAIFAKERWGERFIGIYYNDELGGVMLDGNAYLGSVTKRADGTIQGNNGVTYFPNGEVHDYVCNTITYHPNGTITQQPGSEYNDLTIINGTEFTVQIPSYEQILKQNPIQNYDDAANVFVDYGTYTMGLINKTQLVEESMLVFTSDYGLYWWDYQSGYDMMLAQLGWNNSITQEIGLVRGAANLQGKSWGTMITWKYNQSPYLADGNEIYEQMKTSYEAGAEYVLIFNYSEDPSNPNTLQEEHFQALKRFWNDVVRNPQVTHGNIKAEAVLVLPQNYGWGMRHPDDHIWGIWRPDDTSQQIWSQLQNKLDEHGLKLDIVYEDPNYPVTEKYSNIYYWNQK
jgi:hypothetical protein